MRRLVTWGLLALTGAAPALAQDFSMPGTSPMDLAPQSQALTSSVIGNLSVGNAARGGGGSRGGYVPRGGVAGGGMAGGGGMGFSTGRVSDARIPFATTPATRKQAVSEYLARLQKNNPQVAPIAARALGRSDIQSIFMSVARPNGLRGDDAADVMAGFLAMGWEIITGGEPSAAAIHGLRRQVAGQLLTVPQMRNPAIRTKFAEELKIHFAVISGGFLSARKEGNVAEYRRGVAAFYRQQTGQDIGRFRLTPAGFAR